MPMTIRLASGKERVGLGCLALFCLPFCGVAVFAAVKGIQALGAGNNAEAGRFALFALVFGLVGFGLLTAAIHGYRNCRKSTDLRQQYPDEPWRWRADWAAGRIRHSTRAAMALAWLFALFWNAISLPALLAIPRELAKGNHGILFILIFTVVGLGLLAWAVRATLQWRRYGESVLELSTMPGAIGGVLTGALHLSTPLPTAEGVRLRLSCINRVVTGSGKHRHVHEHIRRQDDQVIRKNQDIPVFFRLPPEVEPTDDAQPNNRILWRLEATAEVPGVDYSAQFEVPVFAGPSATAAVGPEADTAAAFREQLSPLAPPPNTKIRFDRYAPGGPTFEFPAARHPGVGLALTAVLLAFGGMFGLVVVKHAPVIFAVGAGLAVLFLLSGTLTVWFRRTRVVVQRGQVTVTAGLFGWGRPRTVSAAEIDRIKAAPGMTAGSRVYYDITIHLTNGRRVAAGSMVPDKREADWLVDRLADCLSGRA